MKFSKIKFVNYRCFQDGEIDFSIPKRSSKKRNIILCTWENGGGKTNLMFAFRFALYGMTEAAYAEIPGQKQLPWSLNQNVYNDLLNNGRIGDSKSASVELSFEYKNYFYTIKRTHVFTKNERKISSPLERVVLFVQDRNGDTAGPYQDPKDVRRRIERIIPEKTLYAILCDGERVRKLSSTGIETNQAIQAVIARMTEHELLNLISDGLDKVRRKVHRKITASATKDEDKNLAIKCANLQKNIEDDERACTVYRQRIENNKKELEDISKELEQIDVVKQLERDRVKEESVLKTQESEIEKAQTKLISTLNRQSYWTLSKKLCRTVEKLMEDTTISFPGLEADIVEMVMKGDTCICGRSIDDKIREYMSELRKKLPPFNVDAILSGVMHEYGTAERREDYQRQIRERFESINEIQSKINVTMDNIAELRKRIEASHNPNAAALEKKREELMSQIIKFEKELAVRSHNILLMKAELAELTRRLKEVSKRVSNGQGLTSRIEYIESAQRGIQSIKKLKEENALQIINKYLSETFSILRSKSDSQRQVYITRFEDQHRLVVYHEEKVERELAKKGCSVSEQEREKVIVSNYTGSSMGQLKMASLSFMKAILSYVHEIAENDKNLSDAEYPVLMDAPFGDIKGENYDNAVKHIHTFAEQVIVMLADKEVPEGIVPYVARRYSVLKTSSKIGDFNQSKIIELN